jgi:hypothetical protein
MLVEKGRQFAISAVAELQLDEVRAGFGSGPLTFGEEDGVARCTPLSSARGRALL